MHARLPGRPASTLGTALACSLWATLLAPGTAAAKDLGGRFGVGFNTSFAGEPAIALRYVVPNDGPVNILLEGLGGFGVTDGSLSRATAGGRLLVSTVVEDNMNLYLGAGAGYVTSDGLSSVRLQPVAAIDFFFFGLDNLGFTTAFGLDMDVGGTQSGFTTAATAQAGVTYWF